MFPEHRTAFEGLCKEFADVFSQDSGDLGKTPLMRMEIPTGDNPPISQRPYGLALKHIQWVQDEIETLERVGVITKSVSPWASPIVIVPKKTSPGKPPRRRMCLDYRMLNSLLLKVEKAHTKAKDVLTLVPIPKIDEIYAKLEGSMVYSTFHMRSGYYHLELTPESQPKSAFVVGGPKGGKWEFKRCPFGLTQAPAYFQALVNQVLKGINFAFGYLDDILIFSPNMEKHLVHVRVLFECLRAADLKLTKRKCSFLKAHVQYLGHYILGQGLEPVPKKLEVLAKMPPPKDVEQGILMKYVSDNKQHFEVIVVPPQLATMLLKLAHDDLGHNGTAHTYMILRRSYYWKGMKSFIATYVKRCNLCRQHNATATRYVKGAFEIPKAPMDFISMDLIGEFYPPSTRGNRYALTVICMLTGWIWCIPIPDKTANAILKAYLKKVHHVFGPYRKILSNNGTEFKNDLFDRVAKELGIEHKVYSPPYHPQSNGRIEGFHLFLKACMAKHISPGLERDEVCRIVTAAYNFLPNEHA